MIVVQARSKTLQSIGSGIVVLYPSAGILLDLDDTTIYGMGHYDATITGRGHSKTTVAGLGHSSPSITGEGNL